MEDTFKSVAQLLLELKGTNFSNKDDLPTSRTDKQISKYSLSHLGESAVL